MGLPPTQLLEACVEPFSRRHANPLCNLNLRLRRGPDRCNAPPLRSDAAPVNVTTHVGIQRRFPAHDLSTLVSCADLRLDLAITDHVR